jgi:hypothetical protein
VKQNLLFLLLLSALSGCVKPPTYPSEPQITFKSVSSNYVYSGYTDTITISFTDGEGDIGVVSSTGDSCDFCSLKTGDSSCFNMTGFNVFLIDHRDTCMSTYASANIETGSKYDDISGEIVIITAIDSKKCFAPPQPGCPKDTVVYSIMIKDKAGNRSNIVQTTPIIVDGE